MVFCENDKCKRSSVREWFCDSKMLVSFIFLFLKFGCVHHETPIGVGFIQDVSPKNSSTWNPPRGVSWHLQLGRGITVIPAIFTSKEGKFAASKGKLRHSNSYSEQPKAHISLAVEYLQVAKSPYLKTQCTGANWFIFLKGVWFWNPGGLFEQKLKIYGAMI